MEILVHVTFVALCHDSLCGLLRIMDLVGTRMRQIAAARNTITAVSPHADHSHT